MTDNSGLCNYLFNIISQNSDFEVLEIYNLAAQKVTLKLVLKYRNIQLMLMALEL